MNILQTVQLLLQLGVEYLKLRNKCFFFDILEKFDARIDKLTLQRDAIRNIATPSAQNKAEKINQEIIEEQQKMYLFLQDRKQ